MKTNKQLIDEVDGTMNIEGMPLTKDDKSRMLEYLNDPSKFDEIMKSLIRKHTVITNKTGDTNVR